MTTARRTRERIKANEVPTKEEVAMRLAARFVDKFGDALNDQVKDMHVGNSAAQAFAVGLVQGLAMIAWGAATFLHDEAHNISNLMNADD